MYRIILLAIIAIMINGCGSGSSNSSTNENVTDTTFKVGYLVDSAVSGVEYICGNLSGITNEDGEFKYNESCKVVFKLGGITIGEINATDINSDQHVLPADLVGVPRENTSNENVIKLIQFLQSVDDDNNPYNNITIKEESRKVFENSTLNFSKQNIEQNTLEEATKLVNKQLVSKESALEHYEDVLKNRFNIVIKKEEPIKEEIIVDLPKNELIEEKLTEIDNIKPITKPIIEIIEEIVVKEDLKPIIEPQIDPIASNEEEQKEEKVVLEEKQEETKEQIKEEIKDISPDEKVVDKLPVLEDIEPIREPEIDQLASNEEEQKEEDKVALEEEEKQEVIEEIVEPEVEIETVQEETNEDETKEEEKVVTVNIETENVEENDDSSGFSYENQRDVKIFISTKESLSNKQVLLYEDIEIVATPVGDLETYKNKIISTVFNAQGELNLTYTLGNHITSVWLVIPFYNINMEVPIKNNHIYLTLNEEEI